MNWENHGQYVIMLAGAVLLIGGLALICNGHLILGLIALALLAAFIIAIIVENSGGGPSNTSLGQNHPTSNY